MRNMWDKFLDWADSAQEIARVTPMHVHTEHECMECHQAHCHDGEELCETCRKLLVKVTGEKTQS